MPADTMRVERIRAQVSAERTAIAQIEVKDSYLRQVLGMASNQLDDVEGFFLNPGVQDDLPKGQTDAWLTTAESVLKHGMELRKYVESVIAKFGPDVRSIRGAANAPWLMRSGAMKAAVVARSARKPDSFPSNITRPTLAKSAARSHL